VPADLLVGTVEKLVSKMDETDLATLFSRDLSTMPAAAFGAFMEATFEAFRDRGESSEDAVEGAGTTLAEIERREGDAVRALMEYARSSPGVIKEATTIFVEQHPDFVAVLPPSLRTAIAERITNGT
jgi:hypothetical protein